MTAKWDRIDNKKLHRRSLRCKHHFCVWLFAFYYSHSFWVCISFSLKLQILYVYFAGTSKMKLILSFPFFCYTKGSYTSTFHPIVDKIAASLGYKRLQFAVIIDAGSTGSRVLAYEFHNGYLDNRLVLDKELFHQIKPGLSFYHDKPTEVCVVYSYLHSVHTESVYFFIRI